MAVATLVTGAAFGAALTASGVAQPAVILGQLQWTDYHMLQAFLTATAASAVVTSAANALGYARFSPRQYADRGWFAPYDGNVVGGLALGIGMALSGACPGTVVTQTALRIHSGYWALAGGFAGGAVWSAVLRPQISAHKARVNKAKATAAPTSASASPAPPLPTSVPALIHISTGTALAGLEVAAAAIVGGTLLAFGPGPHAALPPVAGGLLIGLAQLLSVVLRKSTLGVSTVYEDVGDWLIYTTAPRDNSTPAKQPSVTSILFALGIAAGSFATAVYFPALVEPASSVPTVASVAAAIGGFVMGLGSRVAGGCTSGHGISGMSLLSLSSFITIGSAFLGGSVVAYFL